MSDNTLATNSMIAEDAAISPLSLEQELGWHILSEAERRTKILLEFANLKEVILSKRPFLRKLYNEKANYSLLDLVQDNHTDKKYEVNLERKAEFLGTFSEEVKKLLGEEVAESATSQLERYYYVSTAEHHGPVTSPGKLNSALLTSLLYSGLNDPSLKNIIVLACANISFDNYTFPRGIQFNTLVDGIAKLHNLVFFPRAVRSCPVVYFRPYTKESIDTAKSKLLELVQSGDISPEQSKSIEDILDKVYLDENALNSESFSDQVTKTNFELWKLIKGDKRYTNLIYLEQEKIVNSLILKHHIDQDTLVNKFLFDPKYQELTFKHLNGIMGAFTLEKNSGTYLFWGIPKDQKYRVQLWKNGNKLETADGSYSIDLTPEGIKTAILNKEIYPSTLLSFVILSFYYGLRLWGAFNQISYLNQMKKAFVKLLKEAGDTEEAEKCAIIPTTDFAYTRPILTFIGSDEGFKTPATGIDLILYKHEKTFDVIRMNALQITVREALDRAMPELYKTYIPEPQHELNYLVLSPDLIENTFGFGDKISPSLNF